MINVELKTVEPETVAFVEMRGPYTQIPEAMGRLYGWAVQHGLQPAGMPEGVYLDDPKTTPVDQARWEVRTPIQGDAQEMAPDAGSCGIKHIAPHLVAFGMHKGPYEEISASYDELMAWVISNGYDIVGPAEEIYYSDPQTTKPADYLTEIRVPVAKR